MKSFSERVIALLLAILPAIVFGPAIAAEELLDPDAAFRFSAKIVDPETVQVRYQIADGYYMYRNRFHFMAAQGSVKFGAPRLPVGTPREDEFFGKVETYRGSLVIDLPLTSSVSAAGFTLSVVSQGCADIGVCYTPLTQSVKLLPAAYSDRRAGTLSKSPGLLERLQGGAAPPSGEEEFLPVEKAFTVEVRAADSQTLVVRLTPAYSYYLYRDKIRFTIGPDEQAAIDTVQLPRGEPKQDPNFGETEVFHAPVQALIRLRTDTPEQISLILNVGFQGCSEKGLCYPPVTRQHPIALAALAASANPTQSFAEAESRRANGSIRQPAEARRIAWLLRTGNFWLVMASFLGFGLLLSFTPCVLPMIPILSGLIAGKGRKVTRLRGFTLSATSIFGMALAYAADGVLAAL